MAHSSSTQYPHGSYGVEDQVRDNKKQGTKETQIKMRDAMIKALERQWLEARNMGIMEGALPRIHSQMSDSDIQAASRSLNMKMGLPVDHDFGKSAPRNPITAQTAQAPTPAQPQAISRGTGQQNGPAAPVPMVAPVGAGPLQNVAAAAQRMASNAPDSSAFVPADDSRFTQPANGGTRNPLLEKLVRDGTVKPGQKFEQTPAGMSVEMPSASGPRQVQFQPTGEQALEGKFGNVAMQQYGKPWSALEPGQRQTILRANPVARVRGEVLATGQGPFNQRGERFMDTTGGVIKEVDPSRDMTLTRIAKGDTLLPQGAEGGFLVPEKYAGPGGRVASVSRGAYIPNDKLQDPTGAPAPAQTPGAPATPAVPAPQPKYPGRSILDEQQPDAPKNLKLPPQDPAMLTGAPARNPLDFNTSIGGEFTPANLDAPKASAPDPVAQAWEAGPKAAGDKTDSNIVDYSNYQEPSMENSGLARIARGLHRIPEAVGGAVTRWADAHKPKPGYDPATTPGYQLVAQGISNVGTMPSTPSEVQGAPALNPTQSKVTQGGTADMKRQDYADSQPAPSGVAGMRQQDNAQVAAMGTPTIPPPDKPLLSPGPKTSAALERIRTRGLPQATASRPSTDADYLVPENPPAPGTWDDNGPMHRIFNSVGLAKYPPGASQPEPASAPPRFSTEDSIYTPQHGEPTAPIKEEKKKKGKSTLANL